MWNIENTGGNCLVAFKDFICLDGKKRVVGLNDESIVLYTVDYKKYCSLDCVDPEHELVYSDCNNTSALKAYLNEEQINDILTEKESYDNI